MDTYNIKLNQSEENMLNSCAFTYVSLANNVLAENKVSNENGANSTDELQTHPKIQLCVLKNFLNMEENSNTSNDGKLNSPEVSGIKTTMTLKQAWTYVNKTTCKVDNKVSTGSGKAIEEGSALKNVNLNVEPLEVGKRVKPVILPPIKAVKRKRPDDEEDENNAKRSNISYQLIYDPVYLEYHIFETSGPEDTPMESSENLAYSSSVVPSSIVIPQVAHNTPSQVDLEPLLAKLKRSGLTVKRMQSSSKKQSEAKTNAPELDVLIRQLKLIGTEVVPFSLKKK